MSNNKDPLTEAMEAELMQVMRDVAKDLGLEAYFPSEPGELFNVNREGPAVRFSDSFKAPDEYDAGERTELERELFMTDPDLVTHVRAHCDPGNFRDALSVAYVRAIDGHHPERAWLTRAQDRMIAIMNHRISEAR